MKIDLLVDVRSDTGQPHAAPRLPALERCLARGESIPVDGPSFAACLLADFGLQADAAPYAAIALAGEGEDPGDHYWLRADPVSLQPTLHRLTGGALPDGALDRSEARARADLLAPHLRDEGCELVVAHPQRWYVRCPSTQRLRTVPPPRDMGPLDEAQMPAGPDGPRWQRVMTEAQMLFHSADVDRDREIHGRRPVNGIWIWGGGRAPRLERQPYTATYSDDVLALGLARLSGSTISPLPSDARGLAAGGSHDSSRRVLVAIADASDLQWLESNWIAPIVSLVMAGQASELRLRAFRPGRALGCRATRALLRRWWRRARPLDGHA